MIRLFNFNLLDKRHIVYIENKLTEYCKALENADGDKKNA